MALRKLWALPLLGCVLCVTAAAGEPGLGVGADFAPDGSLWRVMAYGSELRVARADHAGAEFGPPVIIPATAATPRAIPEDPPRILAAADGRILVAWSGTSDNGSNRVYISESGNGGRLFSGPRPVGGVHVHGAQIRPVLAEGAGGPELFYLNPMGKSGGQLYKARLPKAGAGAATPIEPLRIADGTCQCCRLDAVPDKTGELVVLSRMIFSGGVRDFGVVRAGSSWRVTDDDWRIDACPEHGGALDIDAAGRWHLTWFTQGGTRQGLFYAVSGDEGRAWSRPWPVGTAGALAGHGDVQATGARVVVSWQEYDGERTAAWVMESQDGGRTFGSGRVLATSGGATDYPRLVRNGAQTYVIWHTRADGYQLLPVTAAKGGGKGAPGSAAPPPREFTDKSLATIATARLGAPFLLVLWSLDCGPCLKELKEFSAVRAAGDDLPLTLVATDAPSRGAEVRAMLERFGLQDTDSWLFAHDDAAKLRFTIDRSWYGELPRSYFYAGDGSRRAHSGGLGRGEISAWLLQDPGAEKAPAAPGTRRL